MSNRKQTAVEYLIEQLEGDDSKIARVIGLKEYNSITKQAKQMEKEQMFEFTKKHHIIGEHSRKFYTEEFEQYYKENYEQ